MPTLQLPDSANHIGLSTRSLGGNQGQASGLLIRDETGREVVHLHSERDMFLSTEGHQVLQIAGTSYQDVRGQRIHVVGSIPNLNGGSGGSGKSGDEPGGSGGESGGSGGSGGESGGSGGESGGESNGESGGESNGESGGESGTEPGKDGTMNSGDLYFEGYFDGIPEGFGLTTDFTYGLSLGAGVGFASDIQLGGKLSIEVDPLSWLGAAAPAINPILGPLTGSNELLFTRQLGLRTNDYIELIFGEHIDIQPNEIDVKVLKVLCMAYNIVGMLELLAYGSYACWARKTELNRVKQMETEKTQEGKVQQPEGEKWGLGIGGGLLGLGAVVILTMATRLIYKKIKLEEDIEAAKQAALNKNLTMALGITQDAVKALTNQGKTKNEHFAGHFCASYDSYTLVGANGIEIWTEANLPGGCSNSISLNPEPAVGGMALETVTPLAESLLSFGVNGITQRAKLGPGQSAINVKPNSITINSGLTEITIDALVGITLKCGISELKVGPTSMTLKSGLTSLSLDGRSQEAKMAVAPVGRVSINPGSLDVSGMAVNIKGMGGTTVM
jgi:hypothetical protein